VNGVRQLKELVIHYCRHGGSSRYVRDLMNDQRLANFARANPELLIRFKVKGNRHPCISGVYGRFLVFSRTNMSVNKVTQVYGVKNQPVEYLLSVLQRLKMQKARRTRTFRRWHDPVTRSESIQGRWTTLGPRLQDKIQVLQ